MRQNLACWLQLALLKNPLTQRNVARRSRASVAYVSSFIVPYYGSFFHTQAQNRPSLSSRAFTCCVHSFDHAGYARCKGPGVAMSCRLTVLSDTRSSRLKKTPTPTRKRPDGGRVCQRSLRLLVGAVGPKTLFAKW